MLSYFLAQLFGVGFFVLGLGLLANAKYYSKIYKSIIKDEGVIFLSGFMALFAGIPLVLFHNVWEGAWWVVLITVLCWMVFAKGVMLILFPDWGMNIGQKFSKRKEWATWAGVFYAVLGLVLGYYGFFV